MIKKLFSNPIFGITLIVAAGVIAANVTARTPSASAAEPTFAYYRIGKIQGIHRYEGDVMQSHVSQFIYWFANGDDECYVTASDNGGGISCMKKAKE